MLNNETIFVIVLILALLALVVFRVVYVGAKVKKAQALQEDLNFRQNEILICKSKLRNMIINAYKYKNVDHTKQEAFLHIINHITDLGSNYDSIVMPYIDMNIKVDTYYSPKDIGESLEDFFNCSLTISCEKVGHKFVLRIVSGTLDLIRFEPSIERINEAVKALKELKN